MRIRPANALSRTCYSFSCEHPSLVSLHAAVLQCVLKTCLDYVRGCQQCDPASPLTCTACKRHFAFDIPTGQVSSG